MGHRDDPREMYREERERLEGSDVSEDVADRIFETVDALDPEVRSPTFEHDGETVELASSTLRSYTIRPIDRRGAG